MNNSVFPQDFVEELEKCAACGTCQTVCPVYNLSRDDTLSARGRIHLLKALTNGELEPGEVNRSIFNQCLLCYACESVCPSGVKTSKLWINARDYFSRELGSGIKGAAIKNASDWKKLSLSLKAGRIIQDLIPGLHSKPGSFRPQIADRFLLDILPDIIPAQGKSKYRVGYFVGCVSNFFLGNIGVAAVETLSALGCEVVIPKSQVCCGAPAFNNGEMDSARRLAKINVEAFLNADVDIITSADATCGGSFVHEYNQLLRADSEYERFSAKYRELNSLILQLGLNGNLRNISAKVTYHDSCHLRHTQGVKAAPRKILQSLPGIEFREMEGSELCCGFGGSYSLFHAKDSTMISKEKLDFAIAAGAEELAVGSPGCILKLKEEAASRGIDINIKHIVEFIRERI